MAHEHAISRGEHVVRIAYEHGHETVAAVWGDVGNDDLRSRRPDPGVLAVGDVVHVPDAPARTFDGLLTRRDHEIVVDLPMPLLRLRLVRASGVGYAEVDTTASVDGVAETHVPLADGLIEIEVGPHTPAVGLSYAGQEVDVDVAWLQPLEMVEGWHDRLENLGYEPGGLNGEHARDAYALRSAIEEFQCDEELAVDGVIGPVTLARLQDVHGA